MKIQELNDKELEQQVALLSIELKRRTGTEPDELEREEQEAEAREKVIEIGLEGDEAFTLDAIIADNPLINYVYVQATDDFCNRKTKLCHKRTNFIHANNRHVPLNVGGTAGKYMLDLIQIPCVDSFLFVPTSEDEVIDLNGEKYYNLFSDRFYPELQPYDTGEAKVAIDCVSSHLTMLYGEEYAGVVLDFIAHNVQFPGRKILWALCLYGMAQGTGKTIPIRMLEVCMGSKNIHKVLNDEINSSFSTWTQGGCVAYCDEIEITGKERNKRLSLLKDVIGNPSDVSYIPKGKDAIQCPNTQNYIFTTNSINALPLESSDRRWCVLDDKVSKDLHKIHKFCGFDKMEEQDKLQHSIEYFNELYNGINANAGAFRSWLLDRDLSHFNPMSRAPASQAKEEMVEASRVEPYHTIKDYLEENFNPDVIVVNQLVDEINSRPGMSYSTNGRKIGQVLLEMGYESIGRTKISSKNQTVFVLPSSGISVNEAFERARKTGY